MENLKIIESNCEKCNHYSCDYDDNILYDSCAIDSDDFYSRGKDCSEYSEKMVFCYECNKKFLIGEKIELKGPDSKIYCSQRCMDSRRDKINRIVKDNIKERNEAKDMAIKIGDFKKEVIENNKKVLEKICKEFKFSSCNVESLKECFHDIESIIDDEIGKNNLSAMHLDSGIDEYLTDF